MVSCPQIHLNNSGQFTFFTSQCAKFFDNVDGELVAKKTIDLNASCRFRVHVKTSDSKPAAGKMLNLFKKGSSVPWKTVTTDREGNTEFECNAQCLAGSVKVVGPIREPGVRASETIMYNP